MASFARDPRAHRKENTDMRTLVVVLTFAASAYLAMMLMIYLLQGSMVFLANTPGRELTASPGTIGLVYENVSLTTADDEVLHGWYVPARDSAGVVLFFHGNAGNISHRLDSIEIFHELGLDVLIIDYRGYGESSGSPSEQGTYTDAQTAWDYLVDERGIAPGSIVVFGRSLGGAVASWLAAHTTPAAVILESCFTSGPDMAARLYPFLPARLITRLKFPVRAYVTQISSPLLVVHSRQDEIIPFDMGEAVFAAAPGPKEFLELSGDHNGGFLLNRNRYQAAIGEFLRIFVIAPQAHGSPMARDSGSSR